MRLGSLAALGLDSRRTLTLRTGRWSFLSLEQIRRRIISPRLRRCRSIELRFQGSRIRGQGLGLLSIRRTCRGATGIDESEDKYREKELPSVYESVHGEGVQY
jgi:hypothetical protein